MGVKTIAFIGEESNEELNSVTDICIKVPSNCTPRIQEAHIFIGHLMCEYIESKLFD